MELIKDIETLRKYTKLNASTDWDTYRPFLRDAQEKYITPYFGETLLETIGSDEADKLLERILRALGPFSLAVATDEMSINFGESGHTVTRTTTLAPASDAKIKKATDSLLERGWHNLDGALRYVSMNSVSYPSWEENTRLMGTALFGNYNEFQEEGMVDINYSPLTFSRLRMLIVRVEKSETMLLIPSGYVYNKEDRKVMSAMQAYTASRVAELQTNADKDNNLKDAPPIQLLHEGGDDIRNYYTKQASFWKNKITELLIAENAIQDSRELRVNGPDKTIFFAGGKRI